MSTNASGRARPVDNLTEDGRPLQVVTSFARRGNRLNDRQQRAWDAHSGRWVIPPTVATEGPLEPAAWFGRQAPLVVEIGSGNGEALTALAATHAHSNLLALEVWRPGVARTLHRLDAAGVDNVRLLTLDAAWVLEHLLGEGQVDELWVFFPDPWHKKRHHKRRLVSAEFAATAASRLAPGGSWRLATDWPDYAEHMVAVLDAEPRLEGGVVPRWHARPSTKFERRGREADRTIVDLHYRRTGSS